MMMKGHLTLNFTCPSPDTSLSLWTNDLFSFSVRIQTLESTFPFQALAPIRQQIFSQQNNIPRQVLQAYGYCKHPLL